MQNENQETTGTAPVHARCYAVADVPPPQDGSRILAYFTDHGWLAVTWETPGYRDDHPIWCVDDFKHGPYALRGYIEGDLTHWAYLPTEPREA